MSDIDISSLTDRHRTQLDILRNNVSTAPAAMSRGHRKISLQHTSGDEFLPPRPSWSTTGTPRSAPWTHMRTVPAGGYMPSPRRTHNAVGAASFLKLGSPRLTKWTLEDTGRSFQTKEHWNKELSSTSSIDVENRLSSAFMQVERLLAGEVALEDFVLSVEKSEGVKRWALWMEISGRLQVAQGASKAVLGKDRPANFLDEPGWKLKNDRILAQSIMRKPLVTSHGVQVNEDDIADANNPFRDGVSDTHSPQQQKSHEDGSIARHSKTNGSIVASAELNLKRTGNSTSHQGRVLNSVDSTPRTGAHRSRHPHYLHMHWHANPEHHGDEMHADTNVLSMKIAALHLMHQLVGLGHKQMCNTIVNQLSSALRTELCRILIVDEAAQELEPFHLEHHHAESRIQVCDSAESCIAGETMRRKQFLHVQDVATSNLFHPLSDLGPVASRQSKWEHSNLLSLPIASHSGYLEMIIILARATSSFSDAEIEAISWVAVLLGNVIHHNKHLATRESQIHLMDCIAESALSLAQKGCEVQDPHLWMKAFDAQVAQIAIVHRELPSKRPLLYCSCSDTSKEEVSMTCYPLRGMHKRMIQQANGQPWWSIHAEDERGVLDRDVDLGSSEWIGRTSVMLVPVMSGNETGGEGDEGNRVIGIIMVASSERTYTSVHRKMLMTMACHIRQALLKLLKTWEEDETGSYKDSFIMSESALKHAEIDDHVSESYSRPDSRIILERAEAEKEDLEAALRRERMLQAETPKLYEYSKTGIAQMLDQEALLNNARIRAEAREMDLQFRI